MRKCLNCGVLENIHKQYCERVYLPIWLTIVTADQIFRDVITSASLERNYDTDRRQDIRPRS